MNAPLCFVDTNVLVYSRDSSQKRKQPLALRWRQELWRTGAGRLSAQVLHEYYQTVTRKLVPGIRQEEARREVLDLARWKPVPWSMALTELAWDVEDRHKLTFWDALIVAAAQSAGCRYLITEDLNAEQDLDGVLVVNPFLLAPADVLGRSPSEK